MFDSRMAHVLTSFNDVSRRDRERETKSCYQTPSTDDTSWTKNSSNLKWGAASALMILYAYAGYYDTVHKRQDRRKLER